MTLRVKSAVIRVPLIILSGLVFGILGAVAAAVYHMEAGSAAQDNLSCSLVAGTDTITIEGGKVTLKNSSGNLTVSDSSGATCAPLPFTVLAAIQFQVDPTATQASTVALDQTGGIFPCATQLGGDIGSTNAGDGTLEIDATSGESIVVGSDGVNLDPIAHGADPGCGANFTSGTFTDVAAYQLTSGANSGITLSANGGSGTGTAASVPVTVNAGSSTNPVSTVSNSVFTGGGGTSNVFTVNGINNTFQAESGPDSFFDNGSNNTVDFTDVSASGLAINVSGVTQTVGGATVRSGQAAVGSTTPYTFARAAGASNLTPFSTIIGASGGNTTFLDGRTGGFNFCAPGTGNSADFSVSTSQVTVNLSTNLQFATDPGAVSGTALTRGQDTLSTTTAQCPTTGATTISSVTGSTSATSASPNRFIGGAGGPYVFSGAGSGNTFVAGTGQATFGGAGTGNSVDFSPLATATTVNVSGQQVNTTASGTATTAATSGTVTYHFEGLVSPTASIQFAGSSNAKTTFFAGSAPDSFNGNSAQDELSYQFVTNPPSQLSVCLTPTASNDPVQPACSVREAVLGTVAEPFSNIATFDGLAAGNTTFVEDSTGGHTFNAFGSGNAADFAADTNPVVANLSTNLYTGSTPSVPADQVLVGPAGCVLATCFDTLSSNITSVAGSTAGHNVFVAGSTSETFADYGSGPTAGHDAIDFSSVQASSNTALTVNVSGALSNGVSTNTASVGTGSVKYLFNTSQNNDFTSFIGSVVSGENTVFLAGNRPGYSFVGQASTAGNGAADSVDFTQANSGVTVNLSQSARGTVPGCVTVATGCSVGVGGGVDTLSGLSAVTGSANATSGSPNVFVGGAAGPYQFTGAGSGNTFLAGTGAANFGGSGTGNSVDFSPLATATVVNVSGQSVTQNVLGQQVTTDSGTAKTLAVSGQVTYNFGGLATPTASIKFTGSSNAKTTFFAGSAPDSFNGSSNQDELSYQFVTNPAGQLSVCLTPTAFNDPVQPACLVREAVLGTVAEPFSNIATFDGLAGGNTTFVEGSTGGHTFNAFGSGNAADFAADTNPVVANLSTSLYTGSTPSVPADQVFVGPAGCVLATCFDTLSSNITSVAGSTNGKNIFVAGSNSETFADYGSGPTAGHDAIDFSSVQASSSTALTVNVSGALSNGVSTNTASVGTVKYLFNTSQNTDFTSFTGSVVSGENTVFLAGNTSGYNFVGQASTAGNGAADSINFTAANSGVTVNLSQSARGTVPGCATVATGCSVGVSGGLDTLSGLTGVTGSANATSGSPNVFVGGAAGPYQFTGAGSGNTFLAGTGAATFGGSGTGNSVDFSPLATVTTVNVSGQQVNTTAPGTATTAATSGTVTYHFEGLVNPTASIKFTGSSNAKTTFYAGSAPDSFNGSSNQDELSFQFVTNPAGPLSVCLTPTASNDPVQPACSVREAVLGTVAEPFSNIATFDGLNGGNTTFVEGSTGGHTFNAFGLNNAADFSADTNRVVTNLSNSAYLGATPTVPADEVLVAPGLPSCGNCLDTLSSNITSVAGSTAGHNVFVAGSTSETFADYGSGPTAGHDAIDFSSVPASSSTALTVNVSGGLSNGVSTNTASVGTGAVKYLFNTSQNGDFTSFTGSAAPGERTIFQAGNTPGYTFVGNSITAGSGALDSADFTTAASGVTANLSPSGCTGVNTGCTVSWSAGSDIVSGVTAVTGSGNASAASPNVFVGGSAGPYVFSGAGTRNAFVAGTGPATFMGNGTGNSVDFSPLATQTTVNVSTQQVGGTAPATATSLLATYHFEGLVTPTAPIAFFGSKAKTTFYAGSAPDSYSGNSTQDELSFQFAGNTASQLSVCLTASAANDPVVPGCAANEAVLGTVAEPFTNIATFDGMQSGNTTFVEGSAGGHTFNAFGANNQADFSADANRVVANLTASTYLASNPPVDPSKVFVGPASCGSGANCFDVLESTFVPGATSFSSVAGSATAGHNLFVAGSNSETFADYGTVGQDAIDFSSVQANPSTPLTVNVSGRSVSGMPNNHASIAGASYVFGSNFSTFAGNNFTTFTGSGSGSTTFDVSGTVGGYSFTSGGISNTVDFSADPNGITADLAAAEPGNVSIGPSQTDTLAGSFLTAPNKVIGSTRGANTFYGNLLGTTFTSTSTNNTVSYAQPATASDGLTTLGSDAILSNALFLNPDQYDGWAIEDSQNAIPPGTTIQVEAGGGQAFLSQAAIGTSSSDTFFLFSPGVRVDLTNDQQPFAAWSVGGFPTGTALAVTDLFNVPGGVPGSRNSLTIQGSGGQNTFVAGPTAATIEGGGGTEVIDLSSAPAGVAGEVVDMTGGSSPGSVTGPSIGSLNFTPGCALANTTDLCVTQIVGSGLGDRYVANAHQLDGGLLPLMISAGAGSNSLVLSNVTPTATVCMPISDMSPLKAAAPCAGEGFAEQTGAMTPGITFSGISNVTGTQSGGDYMYAGSGPESLVENGTANSGTLDFSNVPGLDQSGVSVLANFAGSIQKGSVSIPPATNATYTWTGFGNLIGTKGDDTFVQAGPDELYKFVGGGGSNTLDVTGTPATDMTLSAPALNECDTGTNSNDGSVSVGTKVMDTFSCFASVKTGALTFHVNAGQTATLNGGGAGTLDLLNDTPGGQGVTVDLGKGTVTVNGAPTPQFSFSGMSNVDGTPYNDLYVPGTSPVNINGPIFNPANPAIPPGQYGLSFAGTTAANSPLVVNLSNSSYTIPATTNPTLYNNALATVPPCTVATNGIVLTPLITMNDPGTSDCSVSNVTGTKNFNDILVAGDGYGTLTGGGGKDRFVLSDVNQKASDTTIVGGTGSSTLDLSGLSGHVDFSLADPGVQPLPDSGSVQIVSGNVNTVLASQGGSNLTAGFGNVTLVGGPGTDVLAAGTTISGQTQTLIAGTGPRNTLIGGTGNGQDVLQGGTQATTFEPGQGNETLIGSVGGNTLKYVGATQGIQLNLSSQQVTVPPGKPFGNTTLQPQVITGGFPGSSINIANARITTFNGTANSDLFLVTGNTLTFNGGGGADLFELLGGNNTLNEPVGAKPTFLYHGGGSDIINGGGSGTVDFSFAPAAVNVNLQTHISNGGFAGPQVDQTLNGISTVIGTNRNFKDILIAGAAGQTMRGQGTGNDLLEASNFGGDILIGGNGNNTFCSVSTCAVPGTHTVGGATAAAENKMYGGLGEDSFFVRNGHYDYINGGGGSFNLAQRDAPSLDTAVNIQVFLK